MSSKKTLVKFWIKYSIKKNPSTLCKVNVNLEGTRPGVCNFCKSIYEKKNNKFVLIKKQHTHQDIFVNKNV